MKPMDEMRGMTMDEMIETIERLLSLNDELGKVNDELLKTNETLIDLLSPHSLKRPVFKVSKCRTLNK